MRPLDDDSDRTLSRLALYLTPEEAERMRQELDRLIRGVERGRLEHTRSTIVSTSTT